MKVWAGALFLCMLPTMAQGQVNWFLDVSNALSAPVTTPALKPDEVRVNTGGTQQTTTDHRQSTTTPQPPVELFGGPGIKPTATPNKPLFDPKQPRAVVGNTVVMCPYKTEKECKQYGVDLEKQQKPSGTPASPTNAQKQTPVPKKDAASSPKQEARTQPATTPSATPAVNPTKTTAISPNPQPDRPTASQASTTHIPPSIATTSTFSVPDVTKDVAGQQCNHSIQPYEQDWWNANTAGNTQGALTAWRLMKKHLPTECLRKDMRTPEQQEAYETALSDEINRQREREAAVEAASTERPFVPSTSGPMYRGPVQTQTVDCRALHSQAVQALMSGQMGVAQAQAIQSRLNAQCGSAYAR